MKGKTTIEIILPNCDTEATKKSSQERSSEIDLTWVSSISKIKLNLTSTALISNGFGVFDSHSQKKILC